MVHSASGSYLSFRSWSIVLEADAEGLIQRPGTPRPRTPSIGVHSGLRQAVGLADLWVDGPIDGCCHETTRGRTTVRGESIDGSVSPKPLKATGASRETDIAPTTRSNRNRVRPFPELRLWARPRAPRCLWRLHPSAPAIGSHWISLLQFQIPMPHVAVRWADAPFYSDKLASKLTDRFPSESAVSADHWVFSLKPRCHRLCGSQK